MGALRPFLLRMKKTLKTRRLVQGALIAAMYAALAMLQNMLLPGTASMAVQFRVAECLCVLALFTPAAAPGLAVGCFLVNLLSAGALPLDPVVGALATLLAAQGMYCLRNKPWGLLPALLLPALTNGILVGAELAIYIGGGFFVNCLYVAIGEAAVLLILGSALYGLLRKRGFSGNSNQKV